MSIKIEICLNGVDSAIAAEKGGADRVELCDNLMEGGTTPSQGMIDAVRAATNIGIMAMVRPRGGDFLYSDWEFDVMCRDTKLMHQHEISGVVFGLLNPNGTIDKERTAKLIELARPFPVTFHRAFDMTRDPFEALDTLLELGVDRLLTSGQELTAWQGLPLISELQKRAGEAMIIMPAVQVTAANAREIVQTAGLHEIHIGSNVERQIPSGMVYQNPRVAMGDDTELPEYAMPYTAADLVNEIVQAVAGL